MKSLILGGARSGKSRFAEQLALERQSKTQKTCIYLATAQAWDEEMAARIAHHKEQRAQQWQLHEEPLRLASAIERFNQANHIVLVDCLTLWMSNCLAKECLESEKQALMELLPRLECDIIFVSNEVGSGVVPLGELSRQFVDQSGWLHQALAAQCERVSLVVAGLPLDLKTE